MSAHDPLGEALAREVASQGPEAVATEVHGRPALMVCGYLAISDDVPDEALDRAVDAEAGYLVREWKRELRRARRDRSNAGEALG